MRWIKSSDWYIKKNLSIAQINQGDTLTREVRFNSVKSKLSIFGYKDGDIRIHVSTKDSELEKTFREVLINQDIPIDDVLLDGSFYTFVTHDVDYLNDFLLQFYQIFDDTKYIQKQVDIKLYHSLDNHTSEESVVCSGELVEINDQE